MSCLLEALGRRHLDVQLADRLWDAYQLFLRDHLLSWVFEHLDDVRRRSESVFCQSVAAAACSFLQTEQEAMYFEVREA
jgi:TorA maturation chaperone TorD